MVFFQFYKKAVRSARDNGAATVLLQLIATFTFLAFVPFYEMKFPSDWKWYSLLVVASIFYAFNDRAQTTVRKNLEVSVYTMLNQLKTVVIIAIGALVFHEALMWNKVVGAGMILFANAMVVFKAGSFKINRTIWLAVGAAVSSAIALSIDVGISGLFNLPIYIAITFVVPMFMIIIVERIKTKNVLLEFKSENGRFYLVTGVAWALNSICFISALRLGTVTVVAPLLAVTVLLNVVFAGLMHKEYNDFWKKILAAFLTIIGVWLIV